MNNEHEAVDHETCSNGLRRAHGLSRIPMFSQPSLHALGRFSTNCTSLLNDSLVVTLPSWFLGFVPCSPHACFDSASSVFRLPVLPLLAIGTQLSCEVAAALQRYPKHFGFTVIQSRTCPKGKLVENARHYRVKLKHDLSFVLTIRNHFAFAETTRRQDDKGREHESNPTNSLFQGMLC